MFGNNRYICKDKIIDLLYKCENWLLSCVIQYNILCSKSDSHVNKHNIKFGRGSFDGQFSLRNVIQHQTVNLEKKRQIN